MPPPYDFTGLKLAQRTFLVRGGWRAAGGKAPPARWVVEELILRRLVTVHTAADGAVIEYAIPPDVAQAWEDYRTARYVHPWDRSRRR